MYLKCFLRAVPQNHSTLWIQRVGSFAFKTVSSHSYGFLSSQFHAQARGICDKLTLLNHLTYLSSRPLQCTKATNSQHSVKRMYFSSSHTARRILPQPSKASYQYKWRRIIPMTLSRRCFIMIGFIAYVSGGALSCLMAEVVGTMDGVDKNHMVR